MDKSKKEEKCCDKCAFGGAKSAQLCKDFKCICHNPKEKENKCSVTCLDDGYGNCVTPDCHNPQEKCNRTHCRGIGHNCALYYERGNE